VSTVSLGDFRAHLEEMARYGLRDQVVLAAYAGAEEGEELVMANIRARLDRHSGKLLTSVRSEVEENPDDVTFRVLAGGEYEGLRVPYAWVQEEGGTVRSSRPNGFLAMPVGPALTGDEQPRYPTARMTPHMVFLPSGSELVSGGQADRGVLINKFTGEVWYVLMRSVEIEGQHYMRDAIQTLESQIPEALAGLWARVLLPGQA
jgi:hypothetical protein